MRVHWQNQGQLKTALAHCGQWWPMKVTDDPAKVTCKKCIQRGFNYNGQAPR